MLLDLLKDIAAEEGLNLSTQRAIAVVRANQAAKELYDTQDLKDSLREGLFDINQGESSVTLPWFVDQVRGMRYFDNRIPVTGDDGGNRYHDGIGNELWYLKWRQKENVVTIREIANESQITFKIPLVETENITINISGPTSNSSRKSETLTLVAGTLEITSVGNYIDPLFSISKDSINNYDVSAYDVDGNLLAVIPNCLYTAYYTIYQIFDQVPPTAQAQFSAVEVLFKRKYVPMSLNTDEFICGARYEKAIFWKYMEHRSKDIASALAYSAKCNQVISQIEANEKAGKRERINFVARPWFKLPYVTPQNFWRRW